ncbi:MAG: MATE family efflux transporter, partial [Firmicutes bacterium]|nr:MATE family efflux transporter [Bacillota bacterium]
MEGKVSKAYTFTSGPLFGPLIKFAMPVLGALILQSLYGAVDLWVVGQYGVNADISAVATGSRMIHTITNVI